MGEVVSIEEFLFDEKAVKSENEKLIHQFQRLISFWETGDFASHLDKSSEVIKLSRQIILMLELTNTCANEAVAVRRLAIQVAIVPRQRP